MSDLTLAIVHHLIAFALVAVVLAELLYLEPNMDAAAVRRISRVDAWYGILAGAILLVGFGRAVFAAKGWDYYAGNAFFWGKIITFVMIGLLSVPPTLAYIKWRKGGIAPSAQQVNKVKRFLVLELLLFAPLIAFAAAMARGFGMR